MIKHICISLALLFVFSSVQAQEQKQVATSSTFKEVKVSPDGKHIAAVMIVEGKRTLAFLDVNTKENVGFAKLPRLSEVGEFFWANNERILIKVNKKEAWRPEPMYYGELFASNIDGTRGEMIYGYRAIYDRKARGAGSRFEKKEPIEGTAEVINLLSDDKRKILISSTPWEEKSHPWDTHWKDIGDRLAAVYQLDIYNGQISTKRITGAPVSYATFLSDPQGDIKIAYGKDRNKNLQLYIKKGEEWQQVPNSNFGNNFKPIAINPEGTHLLALDNYNQTRTGLFKLNLSDSKYTNIVTDEKSDIVGVELSKDNQDIYALSLNDDESSYLMMNQDIVEAQVFKSLLASFPNKKVTITSKSKNNDVFIVKVYSETEEKLYLYNKAANKLSALK